ncbi:MAG: class I SAM-dependent methyltransferase [Chthoniobacterales bacterium]
MNRIEVLSEPKAIGMADEWFQFVSAEHFWMQWRHVGILRALKAANVPLKRALEIGCGSGVARKMLERDLGVPVDGCDLSRTGLEMAEPGRGRLLFYDILQLEPSMLGQYDAVFLLDVVEHITDDTTFLAAALQHLRPGGVMVVNVPASMLLFSQYDRVTGHVRRYTRRSLANLFRGCGLEPEGLTHWGLSMVPVLLARRLFLRMVPPAETMRVGFAPPNRVVQSLFQTLKNIETALPIAMPFGTSLLAWGQLAPEPHE